MASRALTLLLPLLFSVAAVREARATRCEVSSFSEQLELVLAEYERAAPAPAPVTVAASLLVRHLSVHEHDSNMHLLVDLQLEWTDVRLSWNESAWGCSSTLVSEERVWTPDVGLASAGSVRGAGAGDVTRLRLASDGAVSWVQHLDLLCPVSLRLDRWPDDEQTATVMFASRAHTVDELDLKIKNQNSLLNTFESQISGAWQMTAIHGHEESLEVAGETRRGVAWTVLARRRAAAHALAAVVVLLATLLLLLAAALLPPAARAPLAACAALSASLWLTTALVRLPGAGDSPLLVRLMSAACVCAGSCAALSAAVLRLSRRSTLPPPQLRRLLTSTLALYFTSLAPPEELRVEGEGGPREGAWSAAARLVDAAGLGALLLALFVLLCLSL